MKRRRNGKRENRKLEIHGFVNSVHPLFPSSPYLVHILKTLISRQKHPDGPTDIRLFSSGKYSGNLHPGKYDKSSPYFFLPFHSSHPPPTLVVHFIFPTALFTPLAFFASIIYFVFAFVFQEWPKANILTESKASGKIRKIVWIKCSKAIKNEVKTWPKMIIQNRTKNYYYCFIYFSWFLSWGFE